MLPDDDMACLFCQQNTGMGQTRKRYLKLEEVGHCKPTAKKGTRRCLPTTVPSNPACGPHDDHCRLDHAPLSDADKATLRARYLRPRYPAEWLSDEDKWLDNFQIESVMKQYQEAYPWFRFMGALPMDFSAPDPYKPGVKQCLNPDICNLNLRTEYEKGVRAIGSIFNLDPHTKGGSHWIALYIDLHDLNQVSVFFSDSYGMKPPRLVARFMRALRLQAPTAKLAYNARRFQYSSSECGMYSMYFLICMLSGISFKLFVKRRVPDKFMLDLRKVLFSK